MKAILLTLLTLVSLSFSSQAENRFIDDFKRDGGLTVRNNYEANTVNIGLFHPYNNQENNKRLNIDLEELTNSISLAAENRYGRVEIGQVSFTNTLPLEVIREDTFAWGTAGAYRKFLDGTIAIRLPIDLNEFKINGQTLETSASCTWTLAFDPKDEDVWGDNIIIQEMWVHSCDHPEIDFTSEFFIPTNDFDIEVLQTILLPTTHDIQRIGNKFTL